MPIVLSKFAGIGHQVLDKAGCYDTVLDSDSLFFINFLRLRDNSVPELKSSYQKVNNLFRQICVLLDSSKRNDDVFFRKAETMLDMSEFEEICLGYSMKGTSGSGSGRELKSRILATGKEIITAGVREPEIFELVGLFEENIGPDRISDFLGWTIKEDLVEYSRRIVRELGLDKKNLPMLEGLLMNPYNKKALILLPTSILHELPLARDWEDIEHVCLEIQTVRDEINSHIGGEWKKYSKHDKKTYLRKLLLENPDILRKVIEDYRNFNLEEYDFQNDPIGEASWYEAARKFSQDFPLKFAKAKITSKEDVISVVRQICSKFKELIENNGLNEILYDDSGNPRHERIAQKLFHGIAQSYCESNDIDISPEVNSGRGALDFKFSVGFSMKVIVEVKLTSNNQLDHGYDEQLKEYGKAEKTSFPFYLVIDNGGHPAKYAALKNQHARNLNGGIICPELIVVDGVRKPTASKM